MQKPFTINQAMRDTVADKLTVQAVAQHGPRIGADMKGLNDQFWARHRAACEALPGLDKKHWAALIQCGALSATASADVKVFEQLEDRSRRVELICIHHHYKDEVHNTLARKVIGSTAFSTVKQHLTEGRNYNRGWFLKLSSPSGAVPRLNDMEVITDPAQETVALLICQELTEVIDAAKRFRAQAMDVLMACRTSRQVEDLFPEAAKLLPQPVKNEKALAPTELAASVRSMLSAGVPPVTAKA